MSVDPICLVHGLKKSEHMCLYCCLCYKSLTLDECYEDVAGDKWDMCKACGRDEELARSQKKRDKGCATKEPPL